ncbi:MAG: hypothetical protein ABSH17_09350 [Syntrophobacteraceae bacterium]|jgi:hypothetical protein
MEQTIRRNAELVIKEMKDRFGVTLSYDEKSVAWLDDYIARIRADLSRDITDKLIDVLGSFFGECIRHSYGGVWRQTEHGWAISFDDNNAVFPFAKMSKHFDEEGESILGLYTSIPLVFKEVLKGEFCAPSDISTEMNAQEALHIASLLDSLQTHEYLCRKYRCKGDEWYEIGNNRFSMEYHNLAAEEDRSVRAILIELEGSLGPAGSILSPGSERIEDIRMKAEALPSPWSEEEDADFDSACFFARYPRWTRFVPGLCSAYEKWKDDPRFLAEAPKFRPINPSWKP